MLRTPYCHGSQRGAIADHGVGFPHIILAGYPEKQAWAFLLGAVRTEYRHSPLALFGRKPRDGLLDRRLTDAFTEPARTDRNVSLR
jgi:hypothetical protein